MDRRVPRKIRQERRIDEHPVFEFHAHIQRKEHRQIDKCDIHRDEQCRAEQFLSLKRSSLTHLSF